MTDTQSTTGEGPGIWIATFDRERAGFINLAGMDNPDDIAEAIREIVGPKDWQVIDTDNLPLGLTGDTADPSDLADYVAALEGADRNGIPAYVFQKVCEDYGQTVDPDTIHYYGEGRDDSDIAEAVVASIGDLREAVGEDALERYFDWDAFGRDLRIGDGFEIIDGVIVQVQ